MGGEGEKREQTAGGRKGGVDGEREGGKEGRRSRRGRGKERHGRTGRRSAAAPARGSLRAARPRPPEGGASRAAPPRSLCAGPARARRSRRRFPPGQRAPARPLLLPLLPPPFLPIPSQRSPARHVAGSRSRGGLLQRGAADPALPPAPRLPRWGPARPVRAAPELAPLRPGGRGFLLWLDAHPLGRALRQGGAWLSGRRERGWEREGEGEGEGGRDSRSRATRRHLYPQRALCREAPPPPPPSPPPAAPQGISRGAWLPSCPRGH